MKRFCRDYKMAVTPCFMSLRRTDKANENQHVLFLFYNYAVL